MLLIPKNDACLTCSKDARRKHDIADLIMCDTCQYIARLSYHSVVNHFLDLKCGINNKIPFKKWFNFDFYNTVQLQYSNCKKRDWARWVQNNDSSLSLCFTIFNNTPVHLRLCYVCVRAIGKCQVVMAENFRAAATHLWKSLELLVKI